MSSTIDAALEVLNGRGPEFGGGLSNHGPMAAEALCALGREEAVEEWTANYRRRLLDQPARVSRIGPGDWQSALGDVARSTDWEDFFARELDGASWQDVLDRWVPRLAPGLMAGATHGIIRTAHAVRSLAAEETPVRRREFVTGLAYWAARYQRLPGAPGIAPQSSPAAALDRVPILPKERRDPNARSIFGAVRDLDDFAAFEPVVNLVAPGEDVGAFLSELTAAMAWRYLRNGGNASIAYVHTVTAPAALRILLPHLSAETAGIAARYTWQACAAIHSRMYDPRDYALPVELLSRDDIVDRAIYSGDEHAIKFAEACLRENALTPNPAYLAATWDLSARFGRRPV